MDGKQIRKGLLDGALTIGLLIGILAVGYLSVFIYGVVVGSVTNTVTSGDIPVSSAMNTSLAGVETEYIATQDSVIDNYGFVVSLVAVVIVMLVFGFIWAKGKSGGKKSF